MEKAPFQQTHPRGPRKTAWVFVISGIALFSIFYLLGRTMELFLTPKSTGGTSSKRVHSSPGVDLSVQTEAPRKSAATILLDQTTIDLGVLDETETGEANVDFAINSMTPIAITKIDTGCECTAANIQVNDRSYTLGQSIELGSFGRIQILANFNRAFPPGKRTSLVSVETTSGDGTRSTSQISIQFEIRNTFIFEVGSPTLALGAINHGIPREVALSFSRRDGGRFRALGIEPNDRFISTSFASSGDGRRCDVSIRVSGELPMGPVLRKFRMTTNPPSTHASFTILGTCIGRIEMDPPGELYLGVCSTKTALNRTIRLSARDMTTKFLITNMRWVPAVSSQLPGTMGASPSPLVFSESRRLDSHEQNIQIEIAPNAPPGPFDGQLTIDTDLADGPKQLHVPVRGFVY